MVHAAEYLVFNLILFCFVNFRPPARWIVGKNRSMSVTLMARIFHAEIVQTIKNNDLNQLKKIINDHLRPDADLGKLFVTKMKGETSSKRWFCPSLLASHLEDTSILQYMLGNGADPNYIFYPRNDCDLTQCALCVASSLRLTATAEVLLRANADPNISLANGQSPLNIAIRNDECSMAGLLLSNGSNPDIKNRKGSTPLHIATRHRHLNMVKILLACGADVFQAMDVAIFLFTLLPEKDMFIFSRCYVC